MSFILPLTLALHYKLIKALLILVLWVVYISREWYEKQAYGVPFYLVRDPLYTLVCLNPSGFKLVYFGKTYHTHTRKSFHARSI